MPNRLTSSQRRFAARSAIAMAVTALAPCAFALEVTGGDYEYYPPSVNIVPVYFQHARTSDYYVHGERAVSDFHITSDIGLLRYIRTIEASPGVSVEPQAILPFGEVRGSGNAGGLGKASGVADLILGVPVKFLLDPQTRDAVSIGSFVYLPTGNYDSTKPLNLGENRWKGLVQLAYVKHFNAAWALDVIGDVTVFGKNSDNALGELQQDPRYEAQAHLRYNVTPATSLGVDYGYVWGAESRVAGVRQDNRLSTQYARLTATSFLTPTLQAQIQVGSDVSVRNGAKESGRLNLRLTKIF